MQQRYFLAALICGCLYGSAAQAQDPGAAPGATGTVTGTYRGAAATYTTVRAKDGWVWLQQNLGSPQVASSATDAAAYGDLFQWGRWDDGHQQRSPGNVVDGMPTPNNPSGLNLSGDNPFYKGGGITWYNDGTVGDTWTAATPAAATATNGCDPCKQIFGAGWQLPSLSDWQTVLGAEGVNNIANGFASNLKLTAGGGRNELLGSVGDEGVISIYWSSTCEAGSAPQAMYINLYTSNLADYNYRGIGMSLRCLKKSAATSIKEKKTGGLFRLYPNPAAEYAVLDLGSSRGKATITVTDILGQTLNSRQEQYSGKPLVIALKDFPEGLYWIKADCDRNSEVCRLVVRR